MTKTILFVACILCTLSMLAQSSPNLVKWDFDNDVEGWDVNPNNMSVSWNSNGYLDCVTDGGSDPNVWNQVNPAFNTDNINYLQVSIKNETSETKGHILIWADGIDGVLAVTIPFTPNSSSFETINIDLSTIPNWSNSLSVTNVRLDPNASGASGTISYDYIYFKETADILGGVPVQMTTTQPGVGNALDPADYVGGKNKAIHIDIDGDGVDDFTVLDTDNSGTDAFVVDNIGGANGVISLPYAPAPSQPFELVTLGAANGNIGAGNTFNNTKDQLLYILTQNGGLGNFGPGTNNGYIGVAFDISGAIHYGFIMVSFTSHDTWNVDGWGYNATAGADAGFNTLSIGKNQFSDNVVVYSYDNSITIKNLPEAVDYTLYSITGQVVQQGTVQQNDANFSVSSLAPGMYVLKAVGKESGKLLSAKLLF